MREYTGCRSEAAFAELVRRHVDLVHSAALRMVCDAHLAQDVTQGTFLALAQNARKLAERPVLSGWLHRTAQNLAANTIRYEVRRRAREQEAATMKATWKFAGYADPQSGFQSFMWAMRQGDIGEIFESVTPAARSEWERNLTKPKEKAGERISHYAKRTELFRILGKRNVSGKETHLDIEWIEANNETPLLKQWARMLKVGSEWKFEGWVGN